MILGIGVDAVSIERAKRLKGRVLERMFSTEELAEYAQLEGAHEDVRAQFLASRFAVKEAYAKARGTGFCQDVIPNQISTVKNDSGQPYVKLTGTTLEKAPPSRIFLSITHEMPLAIAMVVLQSLDDMAGGTDVQV